MGIIWFPQFDKVLGIRESDSALALSGGVFLTPTNVTDILANTGDALLASANVFTRGQTITQGTADESILTSTGYSVTGSGSTRMFNLSGTWNTSAAVTAFHMDITNTQSGSGSFLMNLLVGGSSKFRVSKDSEIWAQYHNILANGFLDFNSSTNTAVMQYDGASGTVGQRSGTAAQTFNVYDTYTSATDYHRVGIKTARATLASVSGASVTATGLIPDGAVVVGVTTKVTVALGTGSGTTGYTVGDGSDVDRWGAIVGTAAGTSSDNTNWTATTVQAFTSAQDVVITASGGNFNGTGTIYVSVQYLIGQCD